MYKIVHFYITFFVHSYITINIRDKICCEYCFKGAIDDLFNIEGIEEVNSNYLEKKENIIIDIKYNPNIISEEEMRKKELKLNI